MKSRLLYLYICLLVLISADAFAVTDRFSVIPVLRPRRGQDLHGTYSSDTLEKNQTLVQVSGDYIYRPVEVNVAGVRVRGVVDSVWVTTLSVAHGFTKAFDVEVSMPFVVNSSFQDLTLPAPGFDSGFSFGDLVLQARVRLIDNSDHRVGLSFIPVLSLPTGSESRFLGLDGFSLGGHFAFDVRVFEKLTGILNAGLTVTDEIRVLDYYSQGSLDLRAGLRYDFSEQVHLSADLQSMTAVNRIYRDQSTSSLEAGAKLDVQFSKTFPLRVFVGGAYGILYAANTPVFRVSSGLSYSF